MRFRNFLPLFLTLPLVSACGDNSIKVKEPSFEEMKTKVDYNTYITELTSTFSNISFQNENETIGSFEAKYNKGQKTTQEFKLANKMNYEYISKRDADFKYDAINSLTAMEITSQRKSSKSELDGKTINSSSSEEKENEITQCDTIDDELHIVTFDTIDKTYLVGDLVDDEYPAQLNTQMKSSIKSFVPDDMYISDYLELEERKQKRYSFYIDGNIFSFVYECKDVPDEVKDSSDTTKVIGNSETTITLKKQISISDTKIRCVSSEIKQIECKFTANGKYANSVNVKKGGKCAINSEDYLEGEIAIRDVKLTKQDITKYTKSEKGKWL